MLFKDPLVQKKFEEVGIVKLSLLSHNQVSVLSEFVKSNTPILELANKYGFIQGVCIKDRPVKLELDSFIRELITPLCKQHLTGFKALIYTALAKAPGNNSELDLHQDWSLVDESKYCSISLWIPLIDSVIENGAVHVLKGSHKKYLNPRGGSIPSISFSDKEVLKKKMIPMEMKAGEAIFFDQRLLHYSPNNKCENTRISIISSLVPEEAEVYQYYQPESGALEVYRMTDDFFMNYDDFVVEKELRPKGIKVTDFEI